MFDIDWDKIEKSAERIGISQEEMDRRYSLSGKYCDYCGVQMIIGDYEIFGTCSECLRSRL